MDFSIKYILKVASFSLKVSINYSTTQSSINNWSINNYDNLFIGFQSDTDIGSVSGKWSINNWSINNL